MSEPIEVAPDKLITLQVRADAADFIIQALQSVNAPYKTTAPILDEIDKQIREQLVKLDGE